METLEMTVGNCAKCSQEAPLSVIQWGNGLCSSCFSWRKSDEDSKAGSQARMDVRVTKWSLLCPEIYREGSTDFINEIVLASVKRWKFGARGLLCVGPSRKGKTTACWHLLHKIYVLQAFSFIAMSEPEFSIIREKKTRNGGLDGWLNACIATDVFFLDDIGHAATSSKHMEELYHIIEKRTSWKRPVICTTQFSSDELQEKAGRSGSSKTALAILNRLFSFCDIAKF